MEDRREAGRERASDREVLGLGEGGKKERIPKITKPTQRQLKGVDKTKESTMGTGKLYGPG